MSSLSFPPSFIPMKEDENERRVNGETCMRSYLSWPVSRAMAERPHALR